MVGGRERLHDNAESMRCAATASSAQLRITERSALNLGFQEWGKFLGNGPLTAALLSRLLQTCRVFPFPPAAVNLREPGLKLPAKAPRPAILDAI